MNEIQIFNNSEFGQVRALEIDGAPWFVGKDVAEALGYGDGNKNSKALTNAIADHVDDEDKILLPYSEFKGYQNGDLKNISHYGAMVINESGVYALIFGSTLPSAKKFKRWVTSEVLPAIRQTGSYSVKAPKAGSLKEVLEYAKFIKEIYKDRGASPDEITKAVDEGCRQYGVKFPDYFINEKKLTMNDVYDMIDFICSHKQIGNHKPTYDDFIIRKAEICAEKRIGSR